MAPPNWPRNEQGMYEPWNNPRMEELQDAAKDWDNRPTREERWEEMNRTPLSRQALLSGSVSPSQRYAFRQAEMRAAQREIRSGRDYLDIYLEHRQRDEPMWGGDQGMPWYADMPDSWFDDRTPGLPLTRREHPEPMEPAELMPEPGVDGYTDPYGPAPFHDPHPYYRAPEAYDGPDPRDFFRYHFEWEWFLGWGYEFYYNKPYTIAERSEQEEQDQVFRETYQAYF